MYMTCKTVAYTIYICVAYTIAYIKQLHIQYISKVMTNLDSIFKSRDITLPTKVHQVKAMGFSSGHVRI